MCVPASQNPMQAWTPSPPPPGLLGLCIAEPPSSGTGELLEAPGGGDPPPEKSLVGGADKGADGATCGAGVAGPAWPPGGDFEAGAEPPSGDGDGLDLLLDDCPAAPFPPLLEPPL